MVVLSALLLMSATHPLAMGTEPAPPNHTQGAQDLAGRSGMLARDPARASPPPRPAAQPVEDDSGHRQDGLWIGMALFCAVAWLGSRRRIAR